MSTGTSSSSARWLRALSRDPLVLATAGTIVAGMLVRLVAPESPLPDRFRDLPLVALSVAALALRAISLPAGRERRFWQLLIVGFSSWLAIRLWEQLPGLPRSWQPELAILRDLLYVAFYCSFAFALDLEPHRTSEGDEPDRLELLRDLTATVVILGLVVYFAVLPGLLDAAEYRRRVPSFVFYSVLDVYLATLLALRARWTWHRPAWSRVYLALLFAALIWVVSDTISVLSFLGVVGPAPIGPLGRATLQLALLAIVIAARLRSVAPETETDATSGIWNLTPRPAARLWGGPLVAYLVALPVLHFTLSLSGILDPALEPLRELLLLVLLLVLTGLAALHEHRIDRDNARLLAESRARTLEAQRLEVLGQLAAGVAHEFNNLMTVIAATAEMVRAKLPPASPEREELRTIDRTVERAAEMVRRLLSFGRQAPAASQIVDLRPLLIELSRTLRRHLPASIVLELDCRPVARPVATSGAALEQIVLNLVINARDAMPRGGVIRIEARAVTLGAERPRGLGGAVAGEYALLTVRDDGVGMTEEVRRHAFEPFFTTKAGQWGSGLGLPMVADLVRLCRGAIAIDSAPGRGTSVEVYLPLAREVEATAMPVEPAAPARAGETILVVEDEPAVRDLAARALAAAGYTVLTAADGLEGLELYSRRRDELALVLSDVVMPGMTGPELHAEIRRLGSTPFVLTTGYSDLESGIAFDPSIPRLLKPWTVEQLAARVREEIDRAALRVSG